MKSSTKKLLKEAFKRGYKKALREAFNIHDRTEMFIAHHLYDDFIKASEQWEDRNWKPESPEDMKRFLEKSAQSMKRKNYPELTGVHDTISKGIIQRAVYKFLDEVDSDTGAAISRCCNSDQDYDDIADYGTQVIYDAIDDR